MGSVFGGLTKADPVLQTAGPQAITPGQANFVDPSTLPAAPAPSFLDAARSGPGGTANAMSPQLTTKGKILTALLSGAAGGLASAGSRTPGQGFEIGSQLPFQMAENRQKLTAGDIQNQTAQTNLQNLPWTIQNQRNIAALNTQKTIAETNKFNAQAKKAETTPQIDLPHLYAQAIQNGDSVGAQKYLDALKAQQPTLKPEAPRTVNTGEGVKQFNPKTGLYDIKVGPSPQQANVNVFSKDDANTIADSIINGEQPPVLTGLYRNAAAVRSSLAKKGFNLTTATRDWDATKRFMGSLNSTQQVRLRQAIDFAGESLDKIQALYDEWQQLAPQTGFKKLNHAELLAAKNLPGRPGAVAQALDAQIADLTSELGNVYMGGNSPTDHSLGLAQRNLASDWNKDTFEEAMKQVRANLKIRKNSIVNAQPAGLAPNSPYAPPAGQSGAAQGGDFFSQFGGKAR